MTPRRVFLRPKEAFLSHAGADRRFVLRLARRLRSLGIRSWYSERHIPGAAQWHDEIGKALQRCDWFLLVLTPRAVKSKWVKRELLFALQEDRLSDRIVPLLVRDCDVERLSWCLSSLQIVDFRKGFVDGLRELLRVWRIGDRPKRKSIQ
jgi:hypothetical protein